MPELPEVETVVRSLDKYITGRTIKGVRILEERIIGYPENIDTFVEGCRGKTISAVSRRGKYIIISLAPVKGHDPAEMKELVIHLRMTGQLLYQPSDVEELPHTCVILKLDNGFDLRFINIRKFGRMYLIDEGDREKVGGLAKLGIEPLSGDFTLDYFKQRLTGRKARIKALLLDQSLLAGMGNIYVDEALFKAGINPKTRASQLTPEEISRLYNSIKEVLSEGIRYRGTTRRDYVDAEGRAGEYQDHLRVYSREGEKCTECQTPIERIKVAGRSSFYCPRCQKLKR